MSLAYAVPAGACTIYHNATYMMIPSAITWGAGVSSVFSDPTATAVTGDVAMRLGERAVVRPSIGICSGNSETDPVFGAGFGLQLTQNSTMTLNLQSGISYRSFDGGSEMTVPIGAAASFAGSGTMGFYAGGSLLWQQLDFDNSGSDSDTNPLLFGGISSRSGSLGWTLGGQLLLGDDTEFGVVAGINFASASSALRNFTKRIR